MSDDSEHFYHLEFTMKDGSRVLHEMDLNGHEVLEILRQLTTGHQAVVSGGLVRWEDAATVRIVETPWPWQAVYEQEMDRLRELHIFDMQHVKEWHVFDVGADVTRVLLRQAMAGQQERTAEVSAQDSETSKSPPNPRDVWVIHGRNVRARDALFAFLTAINLRPIEFSKARTATKKPTPYVGEILEAAFASAQAFVVILSPDDWAWLREDLQEENDPEYEKQATLQARPNVLFEAGMAMGWDPKRTLLIQLSDVRPFSDVGGLHILRMTDSPERRRELAERLSDAGCDVRLDGSMWLRAGNFDEAVPVEASVKDPMGKHSEDALVTARIDRDVGSSGRLRDLLVLENRGAGKAEDISVELDGQPLFSHPTVPSQNEIGVLGPFSRAHYLLAVTLGHPAPSTVSVKWVNPSGETGTFESSLSL